MDRSNGNSPTPPRITDEEIREIHEAFKEIDSDGSGFIEANELKDALERVGLKLPSYQVRQIIQEFDSDDKSHRNKLSVDEFERLCTSLKMEDVAKRFKQVVSKRENLQTIGGLSQASSEGTTHSVRIEEQLAFSHWINEHLGHDPDLKHLLPIDAEGKGLYDKVIDGILLCKIINHSCPDTIDERAINIKNLTLYRKHENLTLALNSAQAIGCNIVNIDGNDLMRGKPHLVLGLLWQIIRIGLFNQINLEHCPGLAHLLLDGEKIEDLIRLPPEAILLRWVNYHLQQAGVNRVCTNFHSDIQDSEIYTHLLYQIAPQDAGVTKEALGVDDNLQRAERMLQNAEKLGCRSFVTAQDVAKGVYKLNLAFVANLFNNHPGLDKPVDGVELTIEETREEKTYRNWMNSLGVRPHVNWLYADLTDGLVIFQLYETIKEGIVDWNRVHQKFSKLRKFMEVLENCNYVVELGKKLKFSLVGIAGQDISEGNPTLTLALIWQLMRAYTLSILAKLTSNGDTPITEKEIVQWVNDKLASAGKTTSIRNFQDPSIQDAKVVLDLIDSIKPGIIDYSLVKSSGSADDNLANAKYALSMARKAGARIYALSEDVSEVRSKMVMTVFACLMALSVKLEM
ncbi:Plastin-2 [Orchesella cincta]|uniref:Plastin-2 n=1 Tax=Orchesella cincta TaxID=48709 RepID=A0A1D2MP37_ORCCI|nr:Plastin-2 [Orchesella cincta]